MERNIIIVTNQHAELAAHIVLYSQLGFSGNKIKRLNSEDEAGKLFFRFGSNVVLSFESNTHKFAIDDSEKWENVRFFFFQGYIPFKKYNQELEYFKLINQSVDVSLRKFLAKYSSKSIISMPEALNFKLFNLLLAQSCGLKIPDTEIFNSYNIAGISIDPKHKISKAITNVYRATLESKIQEGPGTIRIDKLPERTVTFSPSLFQREIEKVFEIRSVYLLGKFYSMAIFSQEDGQTNLDYRNYNRDKPNRCIPFTLPASIEQKLEKVANELNMKFCSFDLIRDNSGHYVFIEVNPEGQIGWVSRNCNYYIEREISKHLSN